MAQGYHSGASILKNSSQVLLPVIALGTYESDQGGRAQIEEAVLEALRAGYRHIDTAALYETEQAVGNAIRRSGVPREEIVVVTKFWNHYHDAPGVERSLTASLDRLGLDYVDLYLMHWPIAFKRNGDEIARDEHDKPIVDRELTANHETTWKAMEALVKSGKTKSIGVSNFTVPLLEKLLTYAEIKPACNQVECHPYLPQNKLLQYCGEHDITLTDFSPLGGQKKDTRQLKEDPTVVKAAERLGCDAAQILISWAVQRGTIPIPKSATASRIKSNFNVPVLPQDVFEEISNIHKTTRIRFCDFDDTWGVDLFRNDSGL